MERKRDKLHRRHSRVARGSELEGQVVARQLGSPWCFSVERVGVAGCVWHHEPHPHAYPHGHDVSDADSHPYADGNADPHSYANPHADDDAHADSDAYGDNDA